MKEKITYTIKIPENLQVSLDGTLIKVKGPKGEVERRFVSRQIDMKLENNEITISTKDKSTKREKAVVGAFESHIKNMFKGVTAGHVYKMKICAGHFPMNVSVSGNELIVKNFLGENTARKVRFSEKAKVKIEGSEIIIESIEKEVAGQTASSFEELTKRKGFDNRIFQDGIYIIEKDGKVI